MAEMKDRAFKTPGANGVAVAVMSAAEFGGEHRPPGILYRCILWLVSLWAMVTNITRAFLTKVFKKPKDSLGRILWDMGRDPNHVSSSFGDRFSRYNHQAKWGAAGWQSLDLFYNYHEKIKPLLVRNLEGWLTRFWIEKMENRQAVANRLKIVVALLSKAFLDFSVSGKEIRLLSIASGSAQAVVDAIKKVPGLDIKVLLIDCDAGAIEEAKRLVTAAGIDEQFSFINDSTKALDGAAKEFKPHIIEMVGFLDYRPRDKAIRLISRIHDHLSDGGTFVTCNIRKNPEKIFLDWLLLWPMIYRDEYELADILTTGGFRPENIDLIYEPFRIHGIAVCRK